MLIISRTGSFDFKGPVIHHDSPGYIISGTDIYFFGNTNEMNEIKEEIYAKENATQILCSED